MSSRFIKRICASYNILWMKNIVIRIKMYSLWRRKHRIFCHLWSAAFHWHRVQLIQIAKNLNVLDWKGVFTLSNISVDLLFRKCIYKLLAVIKYQGTSNSVRHYIANICRLTGKWEIHNLCRDKKPLPASQKVMLQKKLSLLIYVKT